MSEMPDGDGIPRMVVTDEKAAEIEAKLAAIASDTPYEAPEPEAEKTEEVVVETTLTQEEAAVEETVEAPAEKAEETADQSDAPTLPDNVRRSLIATGWDEEEIDNNLSVLGEDFIPIAERVHGKRMDESREWAARGRMVKETEPTEEATTEVASTLAPLDVEDLKAQYGHDPDMSNLIDKMSAKMNTSIEAINQILPIIAEQRVHQHEATDAATKREVDAFFRDGDLASYEGLYGKGQMGDLEYSGDHFNNRMAVLQQADALQVGAAAQQRTVSMTEALGMAHEIVSGDFQMEALRAEMKAKVQQRAKSVTLKPDSSGGPATATPVAGEERPEKSRVQMEADALIALKKVFG